MSLPLISRAPKHKGKQESLSLQSSLKDLRDHISSAMDGLFNLQKFVVVLEGRDPARKAGRTFRKRLKTEWETIADVLQEYRAFNNDVQLLYQNIGEISVEECQEHLTEMASSSSSLEKEHAKLIINQDLPSSPYDYFFEETLRSDVREDEYLFLNPEIPGSYPITQYYESDPRRITAFKDGVAAKKQFQVAMKGISDTLNQLRDFWREQNAFIEHSCSDLDGGQFQLAYEDAKQYAERWSTYDKDIVSSITQIIHVCDVVTIEAHKGDPVAKTSPIVRDERVEIPNAEIDYEKFIQAGVVILTGAINLSLLRSDRRARGKSESDTSGGHRQAATPSHPMPSAPLESRCTSLQRHGPSRQSESRPLPVANPGVRRPPTNSSSVADRGFCAVPPPLGHSVSNKDWSMPPKESKQMAHNAPCSHDLPPPSPPSHPW